jgi:hypothetical protein
MQVTTLYFIFNVSTHNAIQENSVYGYTLCGIIFSLKTKGNEELHGKLKNCLKIMVSEIFNNSRK